MDAEIPEASGTTKQRAVDKLDSSASKESAMEHLSNMPEFPSPLTRQATTEGMSNVQSDGDDYLSAKEEVGSDSSAETSDTESERSQTATDTTTAPDGSANATETSSGEKKDQQPVFHQSLSANQTLNSERKKSSGTPSGPSLHTRLASQKPDGKEALQHLETVMISDPKGDVNISNSSINMTSKYEELVRTGSDDLKCSKLSVLQPEDPISYYVPKVTLEWHVPAPHSSTLEGTSVVIWDAEVEVLNKKTSKKNATKFIVPDKKLKCAKNYFAKVVSHIKHRDGQEQNVPSEILEFVTKPGRPDGIKVSCYEEHFDVEWVSNGANKFYVKICDKKVVLAGDIVDIVDGSAQSCRFLVDTQSKVHYGRKYIVQVIAKLDDWTIRAEKICYFGWDDSPRQVTAKTIDGTNIVELKWKKPESSFWNDYSYAVEVIPEGNQNRSRLYTSNTRKEIRDLSAGMAYYFRVATREADGFSLWSSSGRFETEPCAVQVENFEWKETKGDPAVSLHCTWKPVPEVLSYQLQYACDSRDKIITVDVGGNQNQYTIQDLMPNTMYHASIRARISIGSGAYCEEISKKTGLGCPTNISLCKMDKVMVVKFVPAELATLHRVTLCNEDEREVSKNVKTGEHCSFTEYDFNMKYQATVIAMYEGDEGGSATSEEIMTEPDAIDVAQIHVELDDPISFFSISTEVDPKCTKYKVKIYCKESEEESSVIKMDIDKEKKYAVKQYNCFHEGSIYGVRIKCKNKGGWSKWSDKKTVVTELLPPSSLKIKDCGSRVIFSWTPSKRMKSAHYAFINSNLHDTSGVVERNHRLSLPVVFGETYTFQVWGSSGLAKSKDSISRIFVTAPSAVEVKRSKLYPETSINVKIIGEHAGPFHLTWRESNDNEEENCACIYEPAFAIEGLKPATNYNISARCLYGENNLDESAVCHATTLMTMPGQVTGVKCIDIKNGLKRLEWIGCGNQAVTYSIAGKRNYVTLETMETKNDYLNLKYLNSGIYEFFVTAGEGRSSEPFSFIVPETPAYKFDLVTNKSVSLVCTSVMDADKYVAELWDKNATASPQLHSYESTKGEFWIKYDFECGKEYLLMIYACCDGYRSRAAMHYFYADLQAVAELFHELDRVQPTKKVQFTWKNNDLAKKTHLKLFDHDGSIVDELTTVEEKWEFDDLVPNREYILKAFPNDGVRTYANYKEVKFQTAPSKPDKLVIRKNCAHPTTKFNVEIYSDHSGPFILEVKKENEEKIEEIETKSKKFILNNLEPGCPYKFYVKCKSTDPGNGIEYLSDSTPFTGEK